MGGPPAAGAGAGAAAGGWGAAAASATLGCGGPGTIGGTCGASLATCAGAAGCGAFGGASSTSVTMCPAADVRDGAAPGRASRVSSLWFPPVGQMKALHPNARGLSSCQIRRGQKAWTSHRLRLARRAAMLRSHPSRRATTLYSTAAPAGASNTALQTSPELHAISRASVADHEPERSALVRTDEIEIRRVFRSCEF